MSIVFLQANATRIRNLCTKFTGYCDQVDEVSIRNWLSQFDNDNDSEVGLKLLEYVDFYNQTRIMRESVLLHNQISVNGFNLQNSYFAGFSRAGHSSNVMLNRYRVANNLSSHTLDDHFIYLTELSRLYNKTAEQFYFIEDFAGTGNSVVDIWETIKDFVPNPENVHLLLFAAHEKGLTKIHERTPLKVLCNKAITEPVEIFSPNNNYFTQAEKETLTNYCNRAKSFPLGYGNCQSNVIFFHRAPNNAISILRSNIPEWRGLFPRNP